MSNKCYNSNSVIRPDLAPCNPFLDSTVLCCAAYHQCVNNGLCKTPDGIYYSGGCTDSTYKDANCPEFCTSGEYPAMYMAISLLTCVTGDANSVVECPVGAAVKAGDFCCSVNNTTKTCCDTASNGLGLGPAVHSSRAPPPLMWKQTFALPQLLCGDTNTGSTSFGSGNSLFRAGPGLACMLTICRFLHAYMESFPRGPLSAASLG